MITRTEPIEIGVAAMGAVHPSLQEACRSSWTFPIGRAITNDMLQRFVIAQLPARTCKGAVRSPALTLSE
jgi:hypothetical protein